MDTAIYRDMRVSGMDSITCEHALKKEDQSKAIYSAIRREIHSD